MYLPRHKTQAGFSLLICNTGDDEEIPILSPSFHIVFLCCFPQSPACWSYSSECNALIYHAQTTNQNHLGPPLIHSAPWGSYHNCHTRRLLSVPRASHDLQPLSSPVFTKGRCQGTKYLRRPNIPEIKHQQENSILFPILEK